MNPLITKNLEIDDWGKEKIKIAPEIVKNEENFRTVALRKFQNKAPSLLFDIVTVKKRSTEIIFQGFEENIQSIFMFDYNNIKILGKKYKSDLYLSPNSPGTFCSKIQAPMILGLLEREQLTQDGIILFIKPMTSGEINYIFNELLTLREIDIYYPYTQLFSEKKLEMSSPPEGWKFYKERGKALALGEAELRKYTIHFLKTLLPLKGKILYDPACSTGEFLSCIKNNYPEVYTIGQDLSSSMIEEASKKLDKVYIGDSINSPLPNESVDFIFFRFLNGEVVSTEEAYNLFNSLIKKCKKGGYIVIFGQTPVLVSKQVMEEIGLNFIQANGILEDKKSIFQYYVLKKQSDTKDITYKDLIVNKFLSS